MVNTSRPPTISIVVDPDEVCRGRANGEGAEDHRGEGTLRNEDEGGEEEEGEGCGFHGWVRRREVSCEARASGEFMQSSEPCELILQYEVIRRI